MVSTIVVHQVPHPIIAPFYYGGGIVTTLICHYHMGWSWMWSGLAAALWPEFWLGFLVYFGFQNGFFERFF